MSPAFSPLPPQPAPLEPADALPGQEVPATEPGEAVPPWRVYIVRCLDRTYYTGITTDLKRRLAEHNSGCGARYTRSRRPVVLVYSEPAGSRAAAAKREYQIKKMPLSEKKNLFRG